MKIVVERERERERERLTLKYCRPGLNGSLVLKNGKNYEEQCQELESPKQNHFPMMFFFPYVGTTKKLKAL